MSHKKIQKIWKSLQLRLTLFPTNDYEFDLENKWWEKITGNDPDSKNSKIKTKELSVKGEFLAGNLKLTIDALRAHWIYEVKEPFNQELELATLGDFDERLTEFTETMYKWFQINPQISCKRLAFGALLISPVETYVQGLELLVPYLPLVDIDPVGSSDLLYQINRPINSSVKTDLKLNRLSKWSVLRVRAEAMTEALLSGVVYPESFASRLELDINTSQDNLDAFEFNSIPMLFKELVSLGKEIAENGDRK